MDCEFCKWHYLESAKGPHCSKCMNCYTLQFEPVSKRVFLNTWGRQRLKQWQKGMLAWHNYQAEGFRHNPCSKQKDSCF